MGLVSDFRHVVAAEGTGEPQPRSYIYIKGVGPWAIGPKSPLDYVF